MQNPANGREAVGILEWVLDNRGVLPVLPCVLLGLSLVATLSVAIVKVAILEDCRRKSIEG